MAWADDAQSKCLYWLNGMAGTGKSTIARTVAQLLADKRDLGASFFFKRGERDRGDASKLFTTITAQLMAQTPSLAEHVRAAMEADSAVTEKGLKEQFDKLLLQPLGQLQDPRNGSKKTFASAFHSGQGEHFRENLSWFIGMRPNAF